MIYDIKHITTYSYEAPVASALCALRLSPRNAQGQFVVDSGVDITPHPKARIDRIDFFGNRVVTVQIDQSHRELRIAALSRVDVARPLQPEAEATPEWETIRAQTLTCGDLEPFAPIHFLFPTRLVPLYGPAADYAAESFPTGRPILAGAVDLMRRIRRDFKYDPEATLISTPLSEAFETRGGVCQDFAHIMISGLRGLGLPAAYVSGYIRTIPPEGQPRLEGADASHAWVQIWGGPEHGWLGLDPTNAIQVNDDHIEIGVGRDYADVAPIDGVILSSGQQKLKVSVDVKPIS